MEFIDWPGLSILTCFPIDTAVVICYSSVIRCVQVLMHVKVKYASM